MLITKILIIFYSSPLWGFVPDYFRSNLNFMVTSADKRVLNTLKVLIHLSSQKPKVRCCWFSRFIDFGWVIFGCLFKIKGHEIIWTNRNLSPCTINHKKRIYFWIVRVIKNWFQYCCRFILISCKITFWYSVLLPL